MTQYNTFNVKQSDLKLKFQELGIKDGTEVTLNLSSNVVDNFNDVANSPHRLLLTNTQVSKISKAFANGSSANVNFSKTQLSKMVRVGESLSFLIRLLVIWILKKK